MSMKMVHLVALATSACKIFALRAPQPAPMQPPSPLVLATRTISRKISVARATIDHRRTNQCKAVQLKSQALQVCASARACRRCASIQIVIRSVARTPSRHFLVARATIDGVRAHTSEQQPRRDRARDNMRLRRRGACGLNASLTPTMRPL